jgi:hypothetical protein
VSVTSPGRSSAPGAPAGSWPRASTTSCRLAERCSFPSPGAALRRGGGRGPVPRRAGRPAPAGLARGAPRFGAGSAGRPGLRHARTHAPFTTGRSRRGWGCLWYGSSRCLEALVRRGRLVEGAFRPGGTRREWCDVDVLGVVRRRSLARARHAVEPVEPRVLGRFLAHWHGIARPVRG